MFTLAIVGRPNVGKSTLFNRLAGKRLAIVNDTPGVTRDWRQAEGRLFDLKFSILDTAGLEERFDDSIPGRMRQQTEQALEGADAVLFIVDGRSGLTPLDEHFAGWLRRKNKPVILGVNKAENDKAVQSAMAEAYSLGLGDPIALSAEHGAGMDVLYDVLKDLIPEDFSPELLLNEDQTLESGLDIDALEGDADFTFEQDFQDENKPLKIAIVGRPNVGKSTLMNTLLKENRVMTGPEAGVTRDAVSEDWTYKDRWIRLVDTAGMRKKSRQGDTIEHMAVDEALRAIRLAQIVVLVVDANAPMEKQDLQIAEHIIEEGRALVLAINKWDTITDKRETLDFIMVRLEQSLAQLKDVPYVTLSALKGHNMNGLMDTVLKTFQVWSARAGTGPLNRWLTRIESQNPAPLVAGRQNRLKYITQINTRPPTFALWVSRPDKLPPSYRRYVTNALRQDFDMEGIPVRLLVRRSKNPYV